MLTVLALGAGGPAMASAAAAGAGAAVGLAPWAKERGGKGHGTCPLAWTFPVTMIQSMLGKPPNAPDCTLCEAGMH